MHTLIQEQDLSLNYQKNHPVHVVFQLLLLTSAPHFILSSPSLALVVYYVPEVPKKKQDTSQEQGSVLNIKKIGSLLLLPRAGPLLILKTVCGIPIGILQSMFSLIAMEKFHLPADQTGS